MEESTGCLGRVFAFACVAGLGAVAGAVAGSAIAYVAMSGIYLGGGTSAGAGLFFVFLAFCFAVAGTVLGLVATAFRRNSRSVSGLGVGTAVGFAAGLVVVWLGNRIVAANSRSASENSDVLQVACFAGLACLVAGAILGAAQSSWISAAITVASQRKRSIGKGAVAALVVALPTLAVWLYWQSLPEQKVRHLLHEFPSSPRHSVFTLRPLLTRSQKAIQADVDALGASAVPALIDAVADAGEGFGRNCAARQLGKLKDPRAIEVLVQCVKDRPVQVHEAFSALAEIKDPRAVEPLLVCLQDDNYDIRCLAARTLGGLGDSRSCAPLVAILVDEEIMKQEAEKRRRMVTFGEGLRAYAALGLAHCPDARTFDVLLGVLEDEADDPQVRAFAARSLGRVGDRRAIPALTRAAQGPKFGEGPMEMYELTRDAQWALQTLNRNR